ncbi:MAG: hypothetical protein GDA44_09345 [Prochloron sp. SP5CPC1]|nr:hypothetical protein [Candidatus Paraprochloron terpiosi SP5CPC1]
MKLANPIYYPLSVLVGGVTLVVGVRFLALPNLVIIPAAAAITTGVAKLQKDAEKELKRELERIKIQAAAVAEKAETLKKEANQLLTEGEFQLELLVIVQSACDRAMELPAQINQLARRLPTRDSLLSVQDLEQQLQEVNRKLQFSSGATHQQLVQLFQSLQRNIRLAKGGQDTRRSQIINLKAIIQDSAGTLQQLENKLRTADLTNSAIIGELRSLSTQLNNYQKNAKLLL